MARAAWLHDAWIIAGLSSASFLTSRCFIFAEKERDGATELSQNTSASKPRNVSPRTTAAGFDPEALERGAKALREINASAYAKKVFELMKKQEETRQQEESARKAEFQALQAQHETERQKVMFDEQKQLVQQQAQSKAQLARYEDELARKRMQAEHEGMKVRNAELVKMQEESAIRQEHVKRVTEEKIQAQVRQTEKERAETERETIRVRVMAEADGRVHEAKFTEDVRRRLMVEKAVLEKDKWLDVINTTFNQIGGGLKMLITEQDKMLALVGGVTAIAAGVYATREGARVLWSYVERVLGQPSLVRESSRGKFPWKWKNIKSSVNIGSTDPSTESARELLHSDRAFGNVILHPDLKKRIKLFASSIMNTKRHGAPFRNMLFFGPPGTGKTMVAKELAKLSGVDYALMTGGDVAPLGAQAVTKIHELFNWAGKTRSGLLLFIDEADAFLCQRNNSHMSEAQRSALNAFLYHTGDQSQDLVLVLATNRPGDLDTAVLDRVDEVLEFPLPREEERMELLELYLAKYMNQLNSHKRSWRLLFGNKQEKIDMKDITSDVISVAAQKTEGFSGREIAKLMASVQGAVNGSRDRVLDSDMFLELVNIKVEEHKVRQKLSLNPQMASVVV